MLTNEQLTSLRTLIVPYADKTDVELMDILNQKTITTYKNMTSANLNKWAVMNSARKNIFMAADDYNHIAYEIASAAKFAITNTVESLDISDAEVQALVDGLFAAGVVTGAARTDLYNRATVMVSPAQDAGLPEIKLGYVIAARN